MLSRDTTYRRTLGFFWEALTRAQCRISSGCVAAQDENAAGGIQIDKEHPKVAQRKQTRSFLSQTLFQQYCTGRNPPDGFLDLLKAILQNPECWSICRLFAANHPLLESCEPAAGSPKPVWIPKQEAESQQQPAKQQRPHRDARTDVGLVLKRNCSQFASKLAARQ